MHRRQRSHLFQSAACHKCKSYLLCLEFADNSRRSVKTVPEIWPIFDFSRWRWSAISDLFHACWDHPRRVFGGLCDCAKFACNRRSNFNSMQILIFCALTLKMPIHSPKIGVFAGFYPQNGSSEWHIRMYCHYGSRDRQG